MTPDTMLAECLSEYANIKTLSWIKKGKMQHFFFRSQPTYSTVRNSPLNHMPAIDSNTGGNINSFQIHIKWF